MKIESLHIQGFSSHRDTQISFPQPISFFVGNLGVGKSSIKQALEVALTGSCEGYRKRSYDQKEMIHDLGKIQRFDISVELDLGSLKRGRTMDSTYLAWRSTNGTVQDTEDALFADLGANADLLRVVFNTSDFFALEEKEQLRLILSVTGATVSDEKIRELFTEAHGGVEALKLFDFPIENIGDMAAAYKFAYGERTLAKRELVNLLPPSEPEGDQPPIDVIKKQLTKLREAENELTAKIGELKGHQEGGKEFMQRERTDLKDYMEKMVRPGERDPSEAEVQDLRKQFIVAQEEREAEAEGKATLARQNTLALAELTLRRQQLIQLKSFDGNCVAADFKCPATDAKMKLAIKAQEASIEELQGNIRDLEVEIDGFKFANQVVAIKEKMRQQDTVKEQNRRWVEEMAAAEKKLTALDEALAKEPAKDETGALEAELKITRDRIETGKGILEEAQGWIVRKQEIEKVSKQRAVLEQRKTYLEQLCKFFGPKGVKVSLIGEKLEEFEKSVNKHLRAFGFSLIIQAEPWAIAVSEYESPHSENSRSIRRLSRSERFRLGIALQIAIAKITGVNLLVIDNSELLTPDVRATMIQMLAAAELDQALVFATLMIPEEQFTPPSIDNVEFYMVRNKEGVSEVQAF
jgi:DNA repair exonuclease SbcCD ATPase subunit